MPDSYTAFLNMTKPEVGASPNTWGAKFNTNLDTIDANAKSLDTAVKAARGVADAAVKRAGDTMTGPLIAGNLITAQSADTDAELRVESLATPNTKYRLKRIFSSVNVGGGDDWLFRATRPSDGASQDWVLKSGTGGTIWTTGNFDPNTKVNKAGDVMTGSLGVKGLVTSQQDNAGYVSLSPGSDTNPGYIEWRTKDGTRRGYLGWNDGSNRLQFAAENGWAVNFNSVPLINGNPIYYADNLDLSSRVAKTGDTMSGALIANAGVIIASGAGEQQLWFTRNGFNNWRIFQGWDGQLRFNISDKYFQFQSDGRFSWPQVGDAKTYIDSTADNRLAIARGEYGVKFDKAGGTISGATDFTAGVSVTRTYPSINFHYPNVRQFRWEVREDGRMHLRSPDGGDQSIISVGWGGDLWVKQLGDLNSRIESRATALAEDRASHRFHAARLAFAGDLHNSWNLNNGMAEPYAGSLISSRATIADGTANGAWIPGIFRWRYNQFYANYQGWITAGYA